MSFSVLMRCTDFMLYFEVKSKLETKQIVTQADFGILYVYNSSKTDVYTCMIFIILPIILNYKFCHKTILRKALK